ncbi:hypothetical protein Fot_42412 [Forsythia ovata]|uniref:Uncharacterized protein n=1 Tax=Forsythia ovata TaxID=205694 RepID=A0ABD1RL36_9LAMI
MKPDVLFTYENRCTSLKSQKSGIEELKCEGERQSDVGEDIGPDEDDILVNLDYEMDKGSRPQAEPTIDNNMIIDIGFGDLYEGLGLNSDTDYKNLDDLDNLDSKRELPSRRRTRDFIFNHRVDIVNPQFKTSDMMVYI